MIMRRMVGTQAEFKTKTTSQQASAKATVLPVVLMNHDGLAKQGQSQV